jgi:hypothetical protein
MQGTQLSFSKNTVYALTERNDCQGAFADQARFFPSNRLLAMTGQDTPFAVLLNRMAGYGRSDLGNG